jgi:hypothetical protein
MTYTVRLAEVALIAEANEDGSVIGLNLDDRVDDMPAPESCNKLDFTGPNGNRAWTTSCRSSGPSWGSSGVTRRRSSRAPSTRARCSSCMEFEGLDSFENDNNVTVRIHFGTGPTDVGNDGLLVPGQSFDIKPDTVSVEMRNMRIVDGHMDADTFETVLPVAILDQRFNLPIFSGHVSVDFDTETGEITGLLGGGIPTQTLIDDLILMIPGGQDIAPIASLSLSRLADLEPNDIGGCLHLSTAMTIHGVTAFLLPPSEPVSE